MVAVGFRHTEESKAKMHFEGRVDHVVPFTRGGSSDPSNLQPAHLGCNSRKGTKVEWTLL